ncbi:MAG TPA: DUF4159 domain-containing protein [Candidatus Cloacimonadota bacterium]|nr:DUF4159 domain-containing protein [Candidatus Cloacimonadota bacterium]HPT71531.1 DUF4159 domain-containing protein [Candidatus Cloacimonadota bacterium]
MKLYLIIMLLLLQFSLFCIEKPKLARLQYDGGGDWYNDAEILSNLAKFANNTIHTDFSLDQATVKASDTKLFEYPFLFITGHGNIRFTEKEVEQLRDYLLRGGFIYADDDYGMDESFRREIKRIFPEKTMTELPASHPIFHCYYTFPKGLPKIHKHDDKRPQAFALFDDNGRMMMLYTYESNISDGWADPNTHGDPQEIRDTALRMGVNMLQYVMTNPQ